MQQRVFHHNIPSVVPVSCRIWRQASSRLIYHGFMVGCFETGWWRTFQTELFSCKRYHNWVRQASMGHNISTSKIPKHVHTNPNTCLRMLFVKEFQVYLFRTNFLYVIVGVSVYVKRTETNLVIVGNFHSYHNDLFIYPTTGAYVLVLYGYSKRLASQVSGDCCNYL